MALNVQSLQQLASNLPAEVSTTLGAALRAQDNINSSLNNYLASLFVPNWLVPQMQNGWVPFGGSASPTIPVRYAKYLGLVFITGAMVSGTIGQTAFTLPVGFRPQYDVNFAVDSIGAYGKLVITPDGDVEPDVGNNGFFSLDGCVFFPAQVSG